MHRVDLLFYNVDIRDYENYYKGRRRKMSASLIALILEYKFPCSGAGQISNIYKSWR